ncbi:unnamed protein product [Linum tenue]|uniref:Cucumisin n=1 Tax=Linum tenue TaxID=586396 RepID=A0AAV0KDE4_9ROSI|nr:unnamed protein product [Linum tenue]
MEGVVSVFPSRKKKLHTTRSWSYVGLPETKAERRTKVESDIVIGVIDTGIWPESESFNDTGFGPPPSKWKGTCTSAANFTCNNKIIGARHYRKVRSYPEDDVQSPRDIDGHGTHTASTAAGNLVTHASMDGLGSGSARGGVPSARIAVYKVCWTDGCYDADILAAFDDAIADGVDIISLSVGSETPDAFFDDTTAIGAYHAMKNGVLTSASAGNEGPSAGTVNNAAPWILTVAASTTDRKYVTQVRFGNGETFEGTSINTIDLNNTMYPLVYGGNAPNTTGNTSVLCRQGSLNPSLVQGSIVLCDAYNDGIGPSSAGAIGSIMLNDDPSSEPEVSFSYPLPTSYLQGSDASEYATKTRKNRNATATISKSIEVKRRTAPLIPYFSSRGPNVINSNILKPDIAAPGVDILAAWSPATTATSEEGDERVVKYNIRSGTSMACPHATGAAAYIKSFHPTWSPAAIRSALMTTASPMKPANNRDAEFAYGSGLINLTRCNDPGLVYDAGEQDYIKFMCGQDYTAAQIKLITSQDVDCSNVGETFAWDLNYPSFILPGEVGKNVTRVFQRSVTNVGTAGVASYRAVLRAPGELVVRVEPEVLRFSSVEETKRFNVTVTARVGSSGGVVSGALVWSDGSHQVRSPIVAHTL